MTRFVGEFSKSRFFPRAFFLRVPATTLFGYVKPQVEVSPRLARFAQLLPHPVNVVQTPTTDGTLGDPSRGTQLLSKPSLARPRLPGGIRTLHWQVISLSFSWF